MNIKLCYQPNMVGNKGAKVNQEVLYQLNYLKTELESNAGNKMQQKYPEGFVFINALYGLTWYDITKNLPVDHELRSKAIDELDYSIRQIKSPEGLEKFKAQLALENGAFYRGWLNLLIGRKLLIQAEEERDSSDISEFKLTCNEIVRSIDNSIWKNGNPYLESYIGSTWPADNVVCISSLAMYDQLFTPKYETFRGFWVRTISNKLDTLGLVPHSVNYDSGNIREPSMGSSQSLMNCFWQEIDTTMARMQFDNYEKYFLDSRVGLPGVREHSIGKDGPEHIDSGPIIWDIGGAASIVGIKAMYLNYNYAMGEGLSNSVECFGLPYNNEDQRIYVLGKHLMADGFIAWANAERNLSNKSNRNWKWKFQLLSLLIIISAVWLNRKWVFKKNSFRN